jgi:hypothetical protein
MYLPESSRTWSDIIHLTRAPGLSGCLGEWIPAVSLTAPALLGYLDFSWETEFDAARNQLPGQSVEVASGRESRPPVRIRGRNTPTFDRNPRCGTPYLRRSPESPSSAFDLPIPWLTPQHTDDHDLRPGKPPDSDAPSFVSRSAPRPGSRRAASVVRLLPSS